LFGEPADPQSWNSYSYVRNNPLGRIDPTGKKDLSQVELEEEERAMRQLAAAGLTSPELVQAALAARDLQALDEASTWLALAGCYDMAACWNDRAPDGTPLVLTQSQSSVSPQPVLDDVLAVAASVGVDLGLLAGKSVVRLGAEVAGRLIARLAEEEAVSLGERFAIREAQAELIRASTGLAKTSGYDQAWRVNASITGGRSAAMDAFRALTGEGPVAGVSRYTSETRFVTLRPSKSGPITLEVVDRVRGIVYEMRFAE
jgi:hypothetical protein